MPLQLPLLDDRSYADLVAEARRLIPVVDPEWTNHNPSDPGITLVELFAWLTEMLIYRVDRVTADNQRKFLQLLNGPGWQPGAVLLDDIRATVLAARARERAVTAADFERLSVIDFNQWLAGLRRAQLEGGPLDDWWQVTGLDAADPAALPSAVPDVARASCVPLRNLERGSDAERCADAPAHVSVVVVPLAGGALQPPPELTTALWGFLDARRTLTTRHHVVGPFEAPVSAEIVAAATAGAVPGLVAARVVQGLTAFLDALAGGPAQAGWPFGRDVYVSELIQQLESVEGLDYVTDLMLSSTCGGGARCVPAEPTWHAEGDLVGLALAPHQMPLAALDVARVVIAPSTSFVRADVQVSLQASANADPATLKRLAKDVVRNFFHPLHGGPSLDSAAPTDLALSDLAAALEAIAGVQGVGLTLQADPDALWMQGGLVLGLHVAAGDIVNWQTRVAVALA